VLDDCIARMTEKKPSNEPQKKLLALIHKMKELQDSVVQNLLEQTGCDQIVIHADADDTRRMREAFGKVLDRLGEVDDGKAAVVLKQKLAEAKDHRRSEKGTPKQRKFAEDLGTVRSTFANQGIIAQEPLTTLLEHAFRKPGWRGPERLAKELVTSVINQRGIKAQWKLLEPLLQAMADQVHGVETATRDLTSAIRKIREAKRSPEDLAAPRLAEAISRLDVGAAIHDLARYVESNAPKGQKLDRGAFKSAVFAELNKQENLTTAELKWFLNHAGTLELKGWSFQVQTAAQEYLLSRALRDVE
jgi:hypothetical protein